MARTITIGKIKFIVAPDPEPQPIRQEGLALHVAARHEREAQEHQAEARQAEKDKRRRWKADNWWPA